MKPHSTLFLRLPLMVAVGMCSIISYSNASFSGSTVSTSSKLKKQDSDEEYSSDNEYVSSSSYDYSSATHKKQRRNLPQKTPSKVTASSAADFSVSKSSAVQASMYESDEESEMLITDGELVFKNPRIQRHLLHWLIHAGEQSQVTLAPNAKNIPQITKVTYSYTPPIAGAQGQAYRAISKSIKQSLTVSDKPHSSSEDDASSLPHHELFPHMMPSSFDSPSIRSRFEEILSDDIPTILSSALYDTDSAVTFYNFYRSYFDLPPEIRSYHRLGEAHIPNAKLGQAATPILKMFLSSAKAQAGNYAPLNKPTKEEVRALKCWDRYRKACLIAASLHHPEAQRIVLANEKIFGKLAAPFHNLTLEAEKARHSKRLQRTLSLLAGIVGDILLESQTQTFAGKKELETAHADFVKLLSAIQHPTFGEKSDAIHTEKYVSLQGSVRTLSTVCARTKKLANSPVLEFLETMAKVINKIITELSPFAKARAAFKEAQNLCEMNKKLPPALDLYDTLNNYFTYFPGVPHEQTFLSAYRLVMSLSTDGESESTQRKIYRLAHDCARTYFTFQADGASSNDLFKTYLEFYQLAQSKKTNEDLYAEFMKIAEYYFMKGTHNLAYEVDLLTNADDIMSKALELESRADQAVDDPEPLRSLRYAVATQLIKKRINTFLPAATEEDRLKLCRLYYKHATSTNDLDLKKELCQSALEVADIIMERTGLLPQTKLAGGESSTRNFPEVASVYLFGAGLYFIIAQKKVVAGTAVEDPYLRVYEPFLFDGEALPESETINSSNANYYVFDFERTRSLMLRSLSCGLMMMRMLGREAKLHHHIFFVRICRAFHELPSPHNELIENCLRQEYYSLEKIYENSISQGSGNDDDDNPYPSLDLNYEQLRDDYYMIGSVSRSPDLIRESLRSALSYHHKHFQARSQPDEEDYVAYVKVLAQWLQSSPLTQDIPTQLLVNFFTLYANGCTEFVTTGSATCSHENATMLTKSLIQAAKHPELNKPSFRTISRIVEYLFKAAWLGKDTGLLGQYLTNACGYLEAFLQAFPQGMWPSSDIYYLLGTAYKKAAYMAAPDSELRKDMDERSIKYLQKGNEVSQASETIKARFPELAQFTDQHFAQPSPSSAACLDSFYRFIGEYTPRLKSIPDFPGAQLDDETSNSEDSADDETGSTVSIIDSYGMRTQVGIDLTDELAECSLAQMNLDEIKDNTASKALLMMEREVAAFTLALDIVDDEEAQENVFRSFLLYSITKPTIQRVFARHWSAFKKVRKIMGPSHAISKPYQAWTEPLNKLMALVLIEYRPACLLLSAALKNLSDEDGFIFMNAFWVDVGISRKQCNEIATLFKNGFCTGAIAHLRKVLKNNSHAASLDELIEETEKRKKNDAPSFAKSEYKSLADEMEHLAESSTVPGEKFAHYKRAVEYLSARLKLLHQYDKDLPSEEEYRNVYRVANLARALLLDNNTRRFEEEYRAVYKLDTLESEQLIKLNLPSFREERHTFLQYTSSLLCALVDLKGDAATAEDLFAAFEETMISLKDLEESLNELTDDPATEYEVHKDAKSRLKKRMIEHYQCAQHYHEAYVRLCQKTPLDIARRLKQKVELIDSQEQTARLSAASSSDPVKRYPAQQTFLLKLAGLSLRNEFEKSKEAVTDAQLLELADISRTGYQKAREARLPIIQAQQLKSFLTTESQRQAIASKLSTIKARLFQLAFLFFSKNNSEEAETINSLYTKAKLFSKVACNIQDHEESYESFCTASSLGLTLLNRCHALLDTQAGEVLHITYDDETPIKELATIKNWVAELLLETAKHAPSDEEAIRWLTDCLTHCRIAIPQRYKEGNLSLYLQKEILKALLRKHILAPSLTVPASGETLAPHAYITRPQTPELSPFNSQNPSPVGSPRRESHPLTPKGVGASTSSTSSRAQGVQPTSLQSTLTRSGTPNQPPLRNMSSSSIAPSSEGNSPASTPTALRNFPIVPSLRLSGLRSLSIAGTPENPLRSRTSSAKKVKVRVKKKNARKKDTLQENIGKVLERTGVRPPKKTPKDLDL